MTIFIYHYIREYIMTTNISLIHENVFLLYEEMYIGNDHYQYTRKCLPKTNISLIHERRCIMTIFISYYTRQCITFLFLIIQEDI